MRGSTKGTNHFTRATNLCRGLRTYVGELNKMTRGGMTSRTYR